MIHKKPIIRKNYFHIPCLFEFVRVLSGDIRFSLCMILLSITGSFVSLAEMLCFRNFFLKKVNQPVKIIKMDNRDIFRNFIRSFLYFDLMYIIRTLFSWGLYFDASAWAFDQQFRFLFLLKIHSHHIPWFPLHLFDFLLT